MTYEEFEELTKELYMAYSMQTLTGRALPCIQDGLKPVHRRILYAMKKLSISSTSDYKKSARVVGDVIGKYHPHGDAAVYEAMVGQSQPWKSRYPLVDGQGNFGSRDGDSAAAMRYTESRTTAFADILLEEVNLGAVDFRGNFDQTTEEPIFLPAPIPVILINGSEGIAVGMSSNVPSHNAQEVCDAVLAYLKNNDATTSELMAHIKGPDLATGGHIINSEKELLQCYETGYGRLRVRARWRVLEKARGQYDIEVYELPFDKSPKKLIEIVSSADTYEVPKKQKDKKVVVDQKQLDRKAFIRNFLSNEDGVVDHTSADEAKQGKVRIVISPRTGKVEPEAFMESFIKLFELESTMKFNMTILSLDGRPEVRSLPNIIKDWVEYRRLTIVKRSENRLDKLIRRHEIVLGRIAVMSHIDRVIEIIREEDDPKEVLMDEFSLSERQALDVLEIRLKELQKLEFDKFNSERIKLETEIDDLKALLESKVKQRNLIGRELKAATLKLDNDRRTLIEEVNVTQAELTVEKPKDPVTVFVTKDGWLMSRKGHGLDESPSNMLKPNDKFVSSIETMQDKDLIVFSSAGRSYTISVDSVPSGRKDIHINTLISSNGDKPISIFEYKEGAEYVLIHDHGYGFICSAESLYSKQIAGKDIFILKKYPDAKIVLVEELLDRNSEVSLFTSLARHMRFPVDEIISYPKSQGVKLARMRPNEIFIETALVTKEEPVLWQGVEQDYVDFIKARSATPRNIQKKPKKVTDPEEFSLS
ncbi:DNA topoisomerase (ATP-hydrolyzing) [Vibrio sp. D431a]|uniref:DNA topoisomerase (ATP-hydrolyzing) n=1 Tax=Vibrio sp. D431a TaxID=2837388 RepID=UPI002556C86A|nr:DNA topoisomerase (ATP-hydrolyzing) [Vibrio sp. D431a]MDK9793853.1 DNA topoisomerase 4 subunit A [Vibrio sp. D431a]